MIVTTATFIASALAHRPFQLPVRAAQSHVPCPRSPAVQLCEGGSALELTQPTQAESEEMGLRDWPSTVLRNELSDPCDEGAMRYVLEGSGFVSCGGDRFAVTPNTLVRLRGSGATLLWSAESSEEMVLLTPEYKGPPLLPVVAAFLLASVGLIAVSSGGGS